MLEIEARRVYLSRGFSSLFDYVKRGLGYSDAATWRRINAMKLCTRIDGVRERLWDGSLTLDVSAQKALVEQAAGKSTREVTKMLADVDPALAVPADRRRTQNGTRTVERRR